MTIRCSDDRVCIRCGRQSCSELDFHVTKFAVPEAFRHDVIWSYIDHLGLLCLKCWERASPHEKVELYRRHVTRWPDDVAREFWPAVEGALRKKETS